MNRHQKPPRVIIRNPAYRRAFQRLDAALEEHSSYSNEYKLELLGRHMFGDLWKPRKLPGEDNLPE